MHITSIKFVKGIIGPDSALENNLAQVAFVGRSNVGKSSVINSLTRQKNLARISARPGRTQEINLFLINNAFYLLDLPGYGYAKAPEEAQLELKKVIHGYLFESAYVQKKVVLIIDANVGPKQLDFEMLKQLEKHNKNIVIVANKIDKIKPSEYKKQLADIQEKIGPYLIIPYSAKNNLGRKELLQEIS
ncbi:MAG TPA: ribosome biogenesis GTP-binding protein YihA/YsxC [Candidatus Moranbacteria bacterium]|nr:ribosome biogenesis GTP-binding protein YihA/YsxC [Candidatus Moranbacteria bacterium]